MNNEIYYIFNEHHPTGGYSTVTISRTSILEWMRNRYQEQLKDLSEDRIVEEFCLLHDAWEKPESTKERLKRLGFEEPSEEQKMANLQAILSHLQRGEQNE